MLYPSIYFGFVVGPDSPRIIGEILYQKLGNEVMTLWL